MSPWWLRPSKEEADEPQTSGAANAPEPVEVAPSPAPEPRPEPALAPVEIEQPKTQEPEEASTGPDDADLASGDTESAPSEDDAAAKPRSRTRSRSRRGGRGRGNGRGGNGARSDGRGNEEAAATKEDKPPRKRREKLNLPEELEVADADNAIREFFVSLAEDRPGPAPTATEEERRIAIFCDLENVALGVRDSDIVKKFDINLVLERLLEKGKIIVKKAYCDWERYSDFKRGFHEAAIEMIDIPQKYYSGKNSADIKMVVDAMDMCFTKEHLDTFVIISGDSDFSPLVSKLKEYNKSVIGVGVKNSTSNLLVDNCDEFLYYEDVWRDRQKAPKLGALPAKQAEAFELMIDALKALIRDNKDVLWGSMVKQTMQRKRPSFNEGYYGYSAFSELLEDAQRYGIIKLKKDRRSGSYVIAGFGSPKGG